MRLLTGKLSSDECEGLYSVDLIENCSDLPPSSAASCFTGRNLRQINQTRSHYHRYFKICKTATYFYESYETYGMFEFDTSIWMPFGLGVKLSGAIEI